MKTLQKQNGWFPTIFDELFTENRLDAPVQSGFSRPKVNIAQDAKEFSIALAAPGLKKENFSIEIEKETLVVSAKVEELQDKDDSKATFTRKEFNFSTFKRSFALPETIDTENINATYENGILTIGLPKMEVQKDTKKMIEIS